jgi:DNA-binding response OmpR family regulator
MNKILLIGGTDANRTSLKLALEAAGFRVSSAVTRKYTNRWLGRRIKPFDLIIYDVEEAAQGSDFWSELRQEAGQTPLIAVAATADLLDYHALGVNRVLHRPKTVADIVAEAKLLLS